MKYFLVAFSLFCFLFSNAANALDIEKVRIGVHPDKTRIVIETAQASDYKAFLLQNPYRLAIDMPLFVWQAGTPSIPQNSAIKDVRYGTNKPGVSRIVFDLSGPYKINKVFSLPSEGQKDERIVIDLKKSNAGNFAQDAKEDHGTLDFKKMQASAPRVFKAPDKPLAANKNTKPIIVIDPGHGGQDPGAVSPQKIYEKNITLALSKELKKQLESTGRYRVKLTRETDKYIKLRNRVALARKWDADLFISIHADSINKKDVRGASIYTLSDKASDKQTARLAERENRADIIAGVDLTHEDETVANILIDLASTQTKNQSRYFANLMVDQFRADRVRVLPNTHRYAGFAVLKAPDVPSVLVEAGFLSNKTEAIMLNKKDYRQKIAKTLTKGIDHYFVQIAQNNS